MFDLESATNRRHTPEPDLVPILDGLTAVIFFLLLSISFIGLTKLTLPPSTASVTSLSQEVPVSARVVGQIQGAQILLKLQWLGPTPGSVEEKVPRVEIPGANSLLVEAAHRLAQELKRRFPKEKTIQIALSPDANYQELISIMDGLRKKQTYEDLVLSSYVDAK
jgi:biopolymer transport protein ExbD